MNTRMRPSSSFFQTTSRSPYQILRSCPLWSVSRCYRCSARWWFPEWPFGLNPYILHSRFKNIWKFKNELRYRGLVGDLWDAHLCFLHLCRHFGEPCGAAVCVVFCVYCLHGAQKRLSTHLFVSLAFRAWLWHDLDVCYLMHVRFHVAAVANI